MRRQKSTCGRFETALGKGVIDDIDGMQFPTALSGIVPCSSAARVRCRCDPLDHGFTRPSARYAIASASALAVLNVVTTSAGEPGVVIIQYRGCHDRP